MRTRPSTPPLQLAIATVAVAILTACTEKRPDDEPVHPKPVPPPELAEPDVDPGTKTDPAQERCVRGFTQNDANGAFSAVSGLDAGDCRFEGVRASGSTLLLRWSSPDGAELQVQVGTAGCDEGATHGTFAVKELPDGMAACGGLKDALLAALDNELVPPPTAHDRGDHPGPDGDGSPGPARPDSIPTPVPPGGVGGPPTPPAEPSP